SGADGSHPDSELVLDSTGDLFGTASSGGPSDAGVVFELSPDGTEAVLHAFAGPDGADPRGELYRDVSGDIYGTANSGGAHGLGVAFKLDPAGVLTVLHSFG